jgi:spermidine/putrescine transport system substrate-binding protein
MNADRLLGRRISRRGFLGTAGGAGAAFLSSSMLPWATNPPPATRVVTAAGNGEGSFNWLTWGDHYLPEQLQEASSKYNVKANPSLFSDNSEALLKVQQVGGKQIDMVSGDALWVPKYYEEGLIEPFDLWSLASGRGLFDMALDIPFWKTKEGLSLAFPFGWSPNVIAYNPKYVKGEPDSWEVLWDPKYKGKVVLPNQPFPVMATMGKALGFEKPFQMTPEQLQAAKKRLIALMPNMLKFTEQESDNAQVLSEESAWLGTTNLGIEERVKDKGGPEIKSFVPKEGSIGWMDGEMIVKGAQNKEVALSFLDKMETGEWLAKNFLANPRPLFSREAYHILVKQGYGERAKRYLFDKPEIALSMTLNGPAQDMDAYIHAFNEAISTSG